MEKSVEAIQIESPSRRRLCLTAAVCAVLLLPACGKKPAAPPAPPAPPPPLAVPTVPAAPKKASRLQRAMAFMAANPYAYETNLANFKVVLRKARRGSPDYLKARERIKILEKEWQYIQYEVRPGLERHIGGLTLKHDYDAAIRVLENYDGDRARETMLLRQDWIAELRILKSRFLEEKAEHDAMLQELDALRQAAAKRKKEHQAAAGPRRSVIETALEELAWKALQAIEAGLEAEQLEELDLIQVQDRFRPLRHKLKILRETIRASKELYDPLNGFFTALARTHEDVVLEMTDGSTIAGRLISYQDGQLQVEKAPRLEITDLSLPFRLRMARTDLADPFNLMAVYLQAGRERTMTMRRLTRPFLPKENIITIAGGKLPAWQKSTSRQANKLTSGTSGSHSRSETDLQPLTSDLSQSTNLLANSGFEDPGLEIADGWKPYPFTSFEMTLDASVSHSGTSSLRINAGSRGLPQGLLTHAPLMVKPYQSYALTLWIRTEGLSGIPGKDGRRANPVVITYKTEAASAQFSLGSNFDSDRDWREYSYTIHTGFASSLDLSVGIMGVKAGTVWIDDISLRPISIFESSRPELQWISVMRLPPAEVFQHKGSDFSQIDQGIELRPGPKQSWLAFRLQTGGRPYTASFEMRLNSTEAASVDFAGMPGGNRPGQIRMEWQPDGILLFRDEDKLLARFAEQAASRKTGSGWHRFSCRIDAHAITVYWEGRTVFRGPAAAPGEPQFLIFDIRGGEEEFLEIYDPKYALLPRTFQQAPSGVTHP